MISHAKDRQEVVGRQRCYAVELSAHHLGILVFTKVDIVWRHQNAALYISERHFVVQHHEVTAALPLLRVSLGERIFALVNIVANR